MIDRYPSAAAPATRRIATGFLAGARDCLPIALGVVAYGFAFGVLARQKGLAPLDVLAMSAAVYSGTAQLVALDLWRSPLPLWPIFLSAVIVSLRYLLICASCRPLLAKYGWGRALAAVFLVSDENWAVTMGRAAGGRASAGHLVGGGLVVYLAWCGSTAAGVRDRRPRARSRGLGARLRVHRSLPGAARGDVARSRRSPHLGIGRSGGDRRIAPAAGQMVHPDRRRCRQPRRGVAP